MRLKSVFGGFPDFSSAHDLVRIDLTENGETDAHGQDMVHTGSTVQFIGHRIIAC